MKFENIKTGDLVLVQVGVRHGWGLSKPFWVKRQVARVTPKQFVVGDSKYRKDNGRYIGDRYHGPAKEIGEEEDQSKDRSEFARKINAAHEINKVIGLLKLTIKQTRCLKSSIM